MRLYLDAEAAQEITEENPDQVRKPVIAGSDWVDERSLWIRSDNPTLTYENVVITAQNVPEGVTVQYALDNSGSPGTYTDSIALPNGTFDSAVRFWRKIVVPNVNEAQKIANIKHTRKYDEYVI